MRTFLFACIVLLFIALTGCSEGSIPTRPGGGYGGAVTTGDGGGSRDGESGTNIRTYPGGVVVEGWTVIESDTTTSGSR